MAAAAPLLQSAGVKTPGCFELECPFAATPDCTRASVFVTADASMTWGPLPPVSFALWPYSPCQPLGRGVMGNSCFHHSRAQGSGARLCVRKHLPLRIVRAFLGTEEGL